MEHNISLHALLLQRALAAAYTRVLIHPIARCGIRANYKQRLISQSEVILFVAPHTYAQRNSSHGPYCHHHTEPCP